MVSVNMYRMHQSFLNRVFSVPFVWRHFCSRCGFRAWVAIGGIDAAHEALGSAIVLPVWDDEFASPTFDQCLLADDKRELNQRLARVTARLYGQIAPWLAAAGTL
jgi:hypothetical protein